MLWQGDGSLCSVRMSTAVLKRTRIHLASRGRPHSNHSRASVHNGPLVVDIQFGSGGCGGRFLGHYGRRCCLYRSQAVDHVLLENVIMSSIGDRRVGGSISLGRTLARNMSIAACRIGVGRSQGGCHVSTWYL